MIIRYCNEELEGDVVFAADIHTVIPTFPNSRLKPNHVPDHIS